MRTSKITLLLTLALALAAPAAPASAQQWQERTGRAGWLGITLEPTWMLENGHCRPVVVVTDVVKGAPADRAGVRQGDVLLRINDRDALQEGLPWMAARLVAGDTVRLAMLRDNHEQQIRAIAAERPRGIPLVTARVEPATPGAPATAPVVFGPQPSRVFRVGRDSIIVCSGDVAGTVAPVVSARWQARVDSVRQAIARHVLRTRIGVDSLTTTIVIPDSASHRYVVRVGPKGEAVVSGGTVTFVSPRDLGVGSRAVAGAEFYEINDDLAHYFPGAHQGLLVLQVASGTPAARAGLKGGDVVIRAAAQTLTSIADLRRVVATTPRPLRIEIIREGKHQTLSLPRG